VSECQFELSGADGLILASQVEEENKVTVDQAVDCIWTIQAPANSRVSGAFISTSITSSAYNCCLVTTFYARMTPIAL